jgi:hypothetical protein
MNPLSPATIDRAASALRARILGHDRALQQCLPGTEVLREKIRNAQEEDEKALAELTLHSEALWAAARQEGTKKAPETEALS